MASNSFRHAMGEKNDTGNVYFPHYTYGHRMVMARWGKKMTRAMCTFHTTLTDIAWSWRPFSEDLSMSLQDKQSNVNKTVVMLMLNHLVKKTRVRSHRYKQRKASDVISAYCLETKWIPGVFQSILLHTFFAI
ncbi:hypothetical protein V1264_004733 [Littorina saxatilis]|uniref:Uncharacterized protein n=1 Tax=Littorina saxatilis TaxID=31220 RepID=A0AAN9B4T7_9CAEN